MTRRYRWGADPIDDCDILQAGGHRSVLGHGPVPSTLGTFLRASRFGHVAGSTACWTSRSSARLAPPGSGDGRLLADVGVLRLIVRRVRRGAPLLHAQSG